MVVLFQVILCEVKCMKAVNTMSQNEWEKSGTIPPKTSGW